MKIAMFLASLLLFLLYLYNHRPPRGRVREEVMQTETPLSENAPKAEKRPIRGEDDLFYGDQLETLRKMLQAAEEEVEREERRLDYLKNLNQYGAVINEKNVKRAEESLYRARRKQLTIANQTRATMMAIKKARG